MNSSSNQRKENNFLLFKLSFLYEGLSLAYNKKQWWIRGNCLDMHSSLGTVKEVTCFELTPSLHRRACQCADTLSDCTWDLPTPCHYGMRPAKNCSLPWRTTPADQSCINPAQQVRLMFMHSLIYPHLIQMHILQKQKSNLLYLK